MALPAPPCWLGQTQLPFFSMLIYSHLTWDTGHSLYFWRYCLEKLTWCGLMFILVEELQIWKLRRQTMPPNLNLRRNRHILFYAFRFLQGNGKWIQNFAATCLRNPPPDSDYSLPVLDWGIWKRSQLMYKQVMTGTRPPTQYSCYVAWKCEDGALPPFHLPPHSPQQSNMQSVCQCFSALCLILLKIPWVHLNQPECSRYTASVPTKTDLGTCGGG